jgi:hypothetical protein
VRDGYLYPQNLGAIPLLKGGYMRTLEQIKQELELKGYVVGIAEFTPGVFYLVATKGEGTTMSYWPDHDDYNEFLKKIECI